jgi:hypothetical protein
MILNGLVIGTWGMQEWYLDDELHRTDGPAVIFPNGDTWWYQNGKLHRTDGPAMEYANGEKYWLLNGKTLTEAEFNSPSYREFREILS